MRKTCLLFIILIAVSGCVGQGTSEQSQGAFLGGSQGVEVTFADFPSRINKGFPFDILLEATNQGEDDIDAKDIFIKMANTVTFGIYPNNQTNVEPLTKNIELGGFGGQTYLVFNSSGYKGDILSSESPVPMSFEICYDYTTFAVADMCIARAEFNEVCVVDEEKEVENSGAPVHVTEVRQLNSRIFGDTITLTFDFDVSQVSPSDDIIYSVPTTVGGSGTTCDITGSENEEAKEIQKASQDEVTLQEIRIGNAIIGEAPGAVGKIPNACGSEFISLVNGVGTVRCIITLPGYVPGTGDYVERMRIKLGYLHSSIINEQITILSRGAVQEGFVDTDDDNLIDAEERVRGWKSDRDGDGISDATEIEEGTDPFDPEDFPVNEDGVKIKESLESLDLCPWVMDPDSDDDGLLDGDEVLVYKTDPCNSDSDGDGILDGEDKCKVFYSAINDDSDGDGVGDACSDQDNDGISDLLDTCPLTPSLDNADTDSDGKGNPCDDDDDGDGVLDTSDNCKLVVNPEQTDEDNDGVGDGCYTDTDGDGIVDSEDKCPEVAGNNQNDIDGDGVGDICDDSDGDGVVDAIDNCRTTPNSDQINTDFDKAGDACDLDADNDGVYGSADNCPLVRNPSQSDFDNDGFGDACDDSDGDGIFDAEDNCPLDANSGQANLDSDNFGDVCDDDIDGDGIVNGLDNCPLISNENQSNLDEDAFGDACDSDIDGDGIPNEQDNCPLGTNADQVDLDDDGMGDICDSDDDGDDIIDTLDNCPLDHNTGQEDMDVDGLGDACDDDIDGDGFSNEEDTCPAFYNPIQDVGC